jgi:formylglycine-generating enzyme required for sulfatase activity
MNFRVTWTRAAPLLLPVALLGLVVAPPVPLTAAPVPPPSWKNFTETIAPQRDRQTNADPDGPVTFDMVYIPGGEFVMGSPDGEPGRDKNEGPSHKVRVGASWIGRCEVTWDEFDLFTGDEAHPRDGFQAMKNPPADAITRPSSCYLDETYEHGRAGHPVLCITHHAAMTYCHWLRKKTGRAYRLPTEAEWEFAARGGKVTAYFFGDDPKDLGDYAWFKDNSPDPENFPDKPKGCTHPVGKKKPNPLGLCDVYGNVAEWTLDQYDPKGYETDALAKLSLCPVRPPTEKRWSHVARGGSWAEKPDRCRSAARRVSDASWQKLDPAEPKSRWWLTRMDVIGFRVVLPASEQPELADLRPMVTK